jgi:hypothetical protein
MNKNCTGFLQSAVVIVIIYIEIPNGVCGRGVFYP